MITLNDAHDVANIVRDSIRFDGDPADMMWVKDEDYYPTIELKEVLVGDHITDILNGCTKVVVFCDTLEDYVIKIPFLGTFNSFDGKRRYYENAGVFKWNYCALEEQIYEKACAVGLGDMFCGTMFSCNIDGYPIYVAEKSGLTLDDTEFVCSSSDGSSWALDKSSSIVTESGSIEPYPLAGLDKNTAGRFYDCYGDDRAEALIDFLLENGVNDCHDGNVAYVGDEIKLIDYSSFDG